MGLEDGLEKNLPIPLLPDEVKDREKAQKEADLQRAAMYMNKEGRVPDVEETETSVALAGGGEDTVSDIHRLENMLGTREPDSRDYDNGLRNLEQLREAVANSPIIARLLWPIAKGTSGINLFLNTMATGSAGDADYMQEGLYAQIDSARYQLEQLKKRAGENKYDAPEKKTSFY